jgi:hypothetical protein
MDLADEAGRASTRHADSARGFLPAAAISDLAGTDTKVVFVARHQTTIWKSKGTENRADDGLCPWLRRIGSEPYEHRR